MTDFDNGEDVSIVYELHVLKKKINDENGASNFTWTKLEKYDDYSLPESETGLITGAETLFPVLEANDTLPNNFLAPLKKVSELIGKPYANRRKDKENEVWLCKTCGKSFRFHYALSRHEMSHSELRRFKCEHCGKSFRQMSTLTQHRVIHTELRPHICEICQKSFNRISTLISHRKTHSDVKPHKCPFCDKAFHQKGNLRNHIYTHSNARPYKCLYCGKGFNQISNMMCHQASSHESKKYPCSYCCMIFKTRNSARKHQSECPRLIQRSRLSEIQTPIKQEPRNITGNSGAVFIDAETTILQMDGPESFALFKTYEGSETIVQIAKTSNGNLSIVPLTTDEVRSAGSMISCNGNQIKWKFPCVATVKQGYDTTGRVQCKVEPLDLTMKPTVIIEIPHH